MTSIQIDIKDGLSSSVAIKGPCKVATTANITLIGEQTIDGVAVVTDDRVLVKNQTTASDNGIYVVDTGNWRRSKDFNKTKDVKTGTLIAVNSGTAGFGIWQVTTADPISIGTTSITFVLTLLTASQIAALYQPVDGDLTAISALGTTPYGRALLTMAAAEDLRLAGVLPTYTTQAGLPGLTTTKDALAFVTDSGLESWYKWDGTDLSSRTVIQSITTTTVSSATDTLTKVAHLLSTGSGLMATTTVNGVTTNVAYYAIVVDADNFKLATTPANAIAGTALDITGTTNFTLKQLRDPIQRVFVTKTGAAIDGTAGAWIRQDGAPNFGISSINYKRFSDRTLFGRGAIGWMGDTSGMGSSGAGSWLGDEIAPGSAFAMSYLLVAANVASVPDYTAGQPSAGLFGAARSPAGASNGKFWGGEFYASGWASSGSSVGWAGYFEAVKRPGSNSTMQTLELEITNLNSTPTSPLITPEATYVQGRTFGIFLASGGGNATTYDADSAIWIGSNSSAFRTGIAFYRTSLTKDATTNYQHALLLADKMLLDWYTSDLAGTVGFSIHSEVSVATNLMRLVASDIGLVVNNASGGLALRIIPNGGATANYFTMQAVATGSGSILLAAGGDTNISPIYRGKGTGGGFLQDGASANKVSWSTTGVAFNGTAPVAKGTVGAALSTGGAETNVNLATRINELRTVLINCGLTA